MRMEDLVAADKAQHGIKTKDLDFYGAEILSQPTLSQEAISKYRFLVFDSHEDWSRLLRLDRESPNQVNWLEIPQELQVEGVIAGDQLLKLLNNYDLSTLEIKRNTIKISKGKENQSND